MSEKYADPPNKGEIMDRIKNAPTLGDVAPILKETFPDWMVGTMRGYSPDYPHLTRNWNQMCEQLKIDKKEIVLVEWTGNDPNHQLINIFCDILTRSGFAVRMKHEFFPCPACSLAIPHPTIHKMWKDMKLKETIPETWFPHCSGCSEKISVTEEEPEVINDL